MPFLEGAGPVWTLERFARSPSSEDETAQQLKPGFIKRKAPSERSGLKTDLPMLINSALVLPSLIIILFNQRTFRTVQTLAITHCGESSGSPPHPPPNLDF